MSETYRLHYKGLTPRIVIYQTVTENHNENLTLKMTEPKGNISTYDSLTVKATEDHSIGFINMYLRLGVCFLITLIKESQ